MAGLMNSGNPFSKLWRLPLQGRINQPCARPLSSGPRWGEGNRSRLSFSRDNTFRHCILRSSLGKRKVAFLPPKSSQIQRSLPITQTVDSNEKHHGCAFSTLPLRSGKKNSFPLIFPVTSNDCQTSGLRKTSADPQSFHLSTSKHDVPLLPTPAAVGLEALVSPAALTVLS